MARWSYNRSSRTGALTALALCFVSPILRSQDRPQLTPEEMEKFLKTAKIVKTKRSSKGTTGTLRVTLSDGTLTHDASVQSIDETKMQFKPDNGPIEMNFRDTYKFNIA